MILLKRWLPLILLLLILTVVIYFQGYRYLSFESLKNHRQLLLAWTAQHFIWMIIGFSGIYIIAVACSIPGATFFTLAAGFLFGPL